MKNLYLFIALLYVCFTGYSQQNLQNANWFYALNNAATFLPNPYTPTTIPGSQISGFESCGSVSDQQGNILFYTDGETVWNSNNQVMTNGADLLGNDSNTQLVIIPRPKFPNRYYIISISGISGSMLGLHYTEVDMTNGLGEVIATQKNIAFNDHNEISINQVYGNTSEKVTSTIHSNMVDYWLVAQVNNFIYSYRITDSGPSTIPQSTTPSLINLVSNSDTGAGAMKISPDTQHIGICYKGASGGVCLGEFNNTTGTVTLNPNPITIPNANSYYGMEFSPKNQYAYFTTNGNLYRTTLNGTPNLVADMIHYMQGLQVAINGKIYIATGGPSLLVIDNPDALSNPDVIADPISLQPGAWSTTGLPQWVHWQIFECQPNITLSIPDTNFQPFTYGYNDYIITNNNYRVTEWQEITMTAGDFVELNPNTSIETGSVFIAQIGECTSSANMTSIEARNMSPDETQEEMINGFMVYPNPTNGLLTVKTKVSEAKTTLFVITDITGKELMRVNNQGQNETQLDLSALSGGIYFLSADGIPVQKIIKN